MRSLALVVALAGSSGCTLVALSATASTIGTHNEVYDHQWGYKTPLLIAAGIGAVMDLALAIYFKELAPE